jgi:hypothetical protein
MGCAAREFQFDIDADGEKKRQKVRQDCLGCLAQLFGSAASAMRNLVASSPEPIGGTTGRGEVVVVVQ